MIDKVLKNKNSKYCFVDDRAIFLDREKDRYQYLGKRQSLVLKQLTDFEKKQSSHLPHLENQPLVKNVIDDLVSKNLLTTQHENGSSLTPTTHTKPRSSIYDVYWRRIFSLTALFKLSVCYVLMRRRFQRQTLFQITADAEKIKCRSIKKYSGQDIKNITKKAKEYIDSRFYIYSYYDKCFFDSYLFFLCFSIERIPVDWVFGVNLYPFKAHCWIEYKGIVLNDHLERVSDFTPIYVI